MDIESLSNLFSSISLTNNSSKLSLNVSSQDPIENQLKAGLLIQILKFVLNEMNSTLMVNEDIVLENMKHLIIDSPDFFYLIDKLFSSTHSQISVLMSQFSLTKNFKLRDKIKNTLNQALSAGLITQNDQIFSLV
jgi:hypothetical protein